MAKALDNYCIKGKYGVYVCGMWGLWPFSVLHGLPKLLSCLLLPHGHTTSLPCNSLTFSPPFSHLPNYCIKGNWCVCVNVGVVCPSP